MVGDTRNLWDAVKLVSKDIKLLKCKGAIFIPSFVAADSQQAKRLGVCYTG